jgi:S-DNA-T family DNA segregation ATPase FtsK/SpoIIIE
MPIPVSTALLGLTADGVPLLARLSSPEVAHVLIAGTTGSGKSALLRTIAMSLALAHRSDVLRTLCIDPKRRTFQTLSRLPHLTRPPITEMPEAIEALHSLVRTMEIRDRRGETPDAEYGTSVPRLIVLIDELADLIMQGGKPVAELLTRLLQRGREAGIHLVAATQRPSSAILSGLMRANFPLRLVGRVVSADDARVASGRAGTNAHLLNGRGDFLAISGGDLPLRFQVAYISDKELKQLFKHHELPYMLPVSGQGESLMMHNHRM